jgi:hypothetical protein
MKTKFPAVMIGAAFGALFILGAAVGPAAAWDHRDGGPRFGGRGDFHFDDRRHDRDWGHRSRGAYGPRWRPPQHYHGPQIRLYAPPPVYYYPAYPPPVPVPSVTVVQLSACQQTVGNGLIERFGPGSLVFSGGAFEGTVTLDQQPFSYRCANGQINIW